MNEMENPPGSDTKDIRVHDNHQADNLVRRYGERSVASEWQRPGHVERIWISRKEVLRPYGHEQSLVSGAVSEGSGRLSGVPAIQSGARKWQEEPVVQRIARTGEQETQSEAEPSETGQQVDIEGIADIVYRMMMRELIIERERRV